MLSFLYTLALLLVGSVVGYVGCQRTWLRRLFLARPFEARFERNEKSFATPCMLIPEEFWKLWHDGCKFIADMSEADSLDEIDLEGTRKYMLNISESFDAYQKFLDNKYELLRPLDDEELEEESDAPTITIRDLDDDAD